MIVPYLDITVRAAPCLILLNGVIVGEGHASLPISPQGKVYITCLPISAGQLPALPKTIALRFEDGVLSAPIEGATAHITKEGLAFLDMDIELLPRSYASVPPFSISRAEAELNGRGYVASLVNDMGIMLAIEQRRAEYPELLYPIEDFSSGTVYAANCFTPSDFIVSGEGPKGPRFLLFSASGGRYLMRMDEYAKGEAIKNIVEFVRPLFDVCGHEQRYFIRQEGENLVRSEGEYGFFSGAKREPKTDEDVSRALCEAVKLGLFEEAALYLAPDLKEGLTNEDLNSFIGGFDHIYSISGSGEIAVQLAYELFENCYMLEKFGFSMENRLIVNITAP